MSCPWSTLKEASALYASNLQSCLCLFSTCLCSMYYHTLPAGTVKILKLGMVAHTFKAE